jgi:hypothetical protein
METIEIEGKQVPVTELAAWYAKKATIENENRQTKEALTAANQQLAQSANAVAAIDRVRTDPEFAKQFADTLANVHSDSAFFQETPPPAAPQGAGENQEPNVLTPPPATPPTNQPLPSPDPAVAQQVERLQRRIDEMAATTFVDAKLSEIKDRYPSLDPQKVLERALEEKFPIEHLEAFAATMDNERLTGIIAERDKGSSLLQDLLSPHGEDVDEQLQALGSSLSVAQLNGDVGIDHGSLSTEDHVLKAMAEVGLGSNHPT